MKQVLLLIGLFLAQNLLFAQRSNMVCDSIITLDGRTIVARIEQSNAMEVVYSDCNDDNKDDHRHAMLKANILEIRSSSFKSGTLAGKKEKVQQSRAPWKAIPETHSPKVEKRAFGPSLPEKFRYIVWAGLGFGLGGSNTRGYAVFGTEFGFHYPAIRLAVYASLPVGRPNYYGEYITRVGVNGELGLTAKFFFVGRLSGTVSKGYLGADFFLGREQLQFQSYNISGVYYYRNQYNWKRIMARPGFQFTTGRFALDLCLPVGFYVEKYAGIYGRYYNGGLTIQPTAAAGLRF